jgi:hypothetical protein
MGKKELRQEKVGGGESPSHCNPSERRGHRNPPGKGAPPGRSRAATAWGRPTPHKDVSADREEGAKSRMSCGDDAHHCLLEHQRERRRARAGEPVLEPKMPSRSNRHGPPELKKRAA